MGAVGKEKSCRKGNDLYLYIQILFLLRAVIFGHQKKAGIFEFLKVVAYDSTIGPHNIFIFFEKYLGVLSHGQV